MNDELLERAVKAFGPHLQLDMCVEECAELISAINRLRRGRIGIDDVAQEVADVLLVAQQARLIIGAELVDQWIQHKRDRLQARLDIGGL